MTFSEILVASTPQAQIRSRTRHHQTPPHRRAVATDWDSDRPPEPADVIRRFVKAGCRLPTFGNLRRYLNNTRRQGVVPEPCDMVVNLLPWIDGGRYRELLRWDLPPQPSSPPLLPF